MAPLACLGPVVMLLLGSVFLSLAVKVDITIDETQNKVFIVTTYAPAVRSLALFPISWRCAVM